MKLIKHSRKRANKFGTKEVCKLDPLCIRKCGPCFNHGLRKCNLSRRVDVPILTIKIKEELQIACMIWRRRNSVEEDGMGKVVQENGYTFRKFGPYYANGMGKNSIGKHSAKGGARIYGGRNSRQK